MAFEQTVQTITAQETTMVNTLKENFQNFFIIIYANFLFLTTTQAKAATRVIKIHTKLVLSPV